MNIDTDFQPNPPDSVPGYRITDPETSVDAFKQVNVADREQAVMDALMSLGGQGSAEEISDVLSYVFSREEPCSNITPRLAQLRRKGLVADTELKHKSRQGRNCRVFKLTGEGQMRSTAFRYEPKVTIHEEEL